MHYIEKGNFTLKISFENVNISAVNGKFVVIN